MDWQLCLVELGRKPDRKSWVLGKQHRNGEENDSRKDGNFRKKREGNCKFLSGKYHRNIMGIFGKFCEEIVSDLGSPAGGMLPLLRLSHIDM